MVATRLLHESLDIPQFESLEPRLLLSGTSYIADALADGAVASEGDVAGDANHDSKIDGADLAIWQIHYDPLGTNGVANTWEFGDWNEDDLIDGADLALW